jgi:hypothetical protein
LINHYRNGGSSRYLIIAYIICPSEKKQLIKRLVKKLYKIKKIDPSLEIKGSSLSIEDKKNIANKTVQLLIDHPDIILGEITVSKKNVQPHIQEDANKLYNYMLKLAILNKIIECKVVNLIRDNRTIKVKSGNSLIDYLQTSIWFEFNSSTKIIDIPSDSKKVQNLIFIDWINNIVWGHYEDKNSVPYLILRNKIESRRLFFF